MRPQSFTGLYPCNVHPEGHASAWGCPTYRVLGDVEKERARQAAKYGSNDDLKDGTGLSAQWLQPIYTGNARRIEQRFRDEYVLHAKPTWMHLVREEVAEAFMESDPERLREELIQVAALCVSWCEKIDGRKV